MDLRDQLQQTLRDAYALERELGGGGMSRVFVAQETALGRKVVIKVLPAEMPGQVSIDRFKREISIAARLQHAHIVPLLSAGEVDGLPWFTMPYIEGESLRSRLARGGELPLSDAIRTLREVASALAYAHAHGVVHRDVKPENVLVSGGASMVTDFGVAKALSESTTAGAAGITAAGAALGTPAYMSPEQASADPQVDHRADVYGWGVLAYELLTGSTPFGGRPAAAMLAAHVSEPAEAVTRRRPAVPQALAQLVMRCLEKRPSDRPQGADEIVVALDALVTPSDGAAARAPAPRKTRKRVLIERLSLVAVSVLAVAGAWNAAGRKTGSVLDSVAVMPAEVVGGDTTLAYLAEGLTGGLQDGLLRSGLKVAARASTLSPKLKGANPRDIAGQLGVKGVLSIRMQRYGAQLRVSTELDDAGGFDVWHQTVVKEGTDPLALQDGLVSEIVRSLRSKFANSSLAVGTRTHTPDQQTYEMFLRGGFWYRKGAAKDLDTARTYFLRAIGRDSAFADAYTSLAVTDIYLADAYYPPRQVIPEALDAARRAVTLDDLSSEAHSILGEILWGYYHDWSGAREHIDRAIALDGNNAEPYLWRGWMAMTLGKPKPAVDDLHEAMRRDPLDPFINGFTVYVVSLVGNPDSAIALDNRATKINPEFFYLESFVAEAFRRKGMLDSALALDREMARKVGRPTSGLIVTLARLGRRAEADSLARDLDRRVALGEYIIPEIIARAWLAVGKPDHALDYLEKGVEVMSGGISYFLSGAPEFRTLIGNPRFERVLEQVHLKEVFR
ncbi:MAG: protein kinase [Gemmatimonadales bacterium]